MKTDVQTRHRKQLATMRGWLGGKGYFIAAEALEFVRALEQGTRKDGKTPKFHHQLSVARLVSTLAPHLRSPEATIAAAFLHDVLEDHGDRITREGLEAQFGREVADAVWHLTKKCNGMVKGYDLYFREIGHCPIASVVKLADRAHNLQTMQGVFSTEKQQAYVEEVSTWFHPMIKVARRRFPSQYGAYENLKVILRCQCSLLGHLNGTAYDDV